MKNKLLFSSVLIILTSIMSFVFQNCADLSQDLDDKSSTISKDSALNKLNYHCQNESVANSPLSKTLEINSGEMMYCEFELINPEVGIQSKNNIKGTVDRETPFAISELLAQNWKEGLTKSGKKGIIFRWQPEFTKVESYSSLAYTTVIDRTVIDKVDVIFLPPKTLGLGCMVKGVSASPVKNLVARAGQTIYCQMDNYPGITTHTQNLETLVYTPQRPAPIADFSWKSGKKLNGQNGYVYELLVNASVTTRLRAYFFLSLASGEVVSESVDVTFTL